MDDRAREHADERRDDFQRRANDAIWTHHTWVSELRRAIAEGRSDRTIAEIGDAGTCAIGIWLATEIPAELRDTPLFDRTCVLHERFHSEAAIVLRLALAGATARATAHMAPVGDFFIAAANMRTALYDWANVARTE